MFWIRKKYISKYSSYFLCRVYSIYELEQYNQVFKFAIFLFYTIQSTYARINVITRIVKNKNFRIILKIYVHSNFYCLLHKL